MPETKIIGGDWTHQSLRIRLLISHSGLIEASLCLLRLYMKIIIYIPLLYYQKYTYC